MKRVVGFILTKMLYSLIALMVAFATYIVLVELDVKSVAEAQSLPKVETIFAGIAYYEDDKLERYEDYQSQHPEMQAAEVVVKVNIGLDKVFYNDAEVIQDTTVFPLLINKYHRLPTDYVPKNLVTLPAGHVMTIETKEAFTRLCAGAAQENCRLAVKTAYRSIQEQEQLYQNFAAHYTQQQTEERIAMPGFSEHHTGCAIDVCAPEEAAVAFENTRASQWLQKYAYAYGFIVRYPPAQSAITGYQYEPWHITYVGVKVAKEMHVQGIDTLEEYEAMHINGG